MKTVTVTTDGDAVATISPKDARAGFSALIDKALKGEVVTITRHGKPVAALVPVEAAEIAREAIERTRPGLVAYLKTFPGGEFERNRVPSRDRDTKVFSMLPPKPEKAAGSP